MDGSWMEAGWNNFISVMKNFYKPIKNRTLTNYHFWALAQSPEETFPAYCNRVQQESKSCNFKCHNEERIARNIAVRDQIVTGLRDNEIRKETIKKSWDLGTLRTQGMKTESATRSGLKETVNPMFKPYKTIGKHNKLKKTDALFQ